MAQIELPDDLLLSERPEIELPLKVSNRGAAPLRVWVVLGYDEQLIEADAPGGQVVYRGTLSDEPGSAPRLKMAFFRFSQDCGV